MWPGPLSHPWARGKGTAQALPVQPPGTPLRLNPELTVLGDAPDHVTRPLPAVGIETPGWMFSVCVCPTPAGIPTRLGLQEGRGRWEPHAVEPDACGSRICCLFLVEGPRDLTQGLSDFGLEHRSHLLPSRSLQALPADQHWGCTCQPADAGPSPGHPWGGQPLVPGESRGSPPDTVLGQTWSAGGWQVLRTNHIVSFPKAPAGGLATCRGPSGTRLSL